MKTKISALLLALILIIVGFLGINYLSRSQSDIQGTESEVPESTESQLPENQSVRLFEDEIDYEIDNLLRIVGSIADQQIIEIVDAAFQWQFPETSTEILGKGLTIENTSLETQEAILQYFEDNDFFVSELNTDVDNVGSRFGFVKDVLACIVRSSALEDSENVNLEIRCGPIEGGPADTDETGDTAEAIKQLFAEKYEREVENIRLSFAQETEDYLAGTVSFLKEGETTPSPGNSGGFLAARNESGEWVLVFDGNGTVSCTEIEPYDFPLEMVSECFDEESQTLINLAQ
jgi:hypothetical protein